MSGWSIKNSPGSNEPTNAYIPPGGFSKWRAAFQKAQQGTGVATMAFLGASITGLGAGGTASTDLLTKPYGALLRQGLINKYGIGIVHGDSMLPSASAAYNNTVTWSAVPFTTDVNPGSWSYIGPFTMPVWTTQTTQPLMHYIHPSTALGYNARSLRVHYWDFGNQDGGANGAGRTWSAVETVDSVTNNITLLGDNLIHTSDFTALSNAASHRLNFGNQGAASVAAGIINVASYPGVAIGTSGIHFDWWGQSGGCSLSDFARQDGTSPKDRISRLIGPSNAAPLYTANSALNPPFAPDLVFIDIWDDPLFVNNATVVTGATPNFTGTGVPVDTYLTMLTRVTNALRQKVDANNKPAVDIVFHLPNYPDAVTSDVNAAGNFQNLAQYYPAIKNWAELNGFGWLDTDAEWGQKGLTLGFMTTANPHPTDAGHLDIYNRIVSRLGLP